MKLLFDQNISHRVIGLLKKEFPLAQQVRELGLEDATDKDIWEYSKKKHNFSIVTFDADFYDLNVLLGTPPQIIWLRLGNMSTKNIASFLQKKDIITAFLSETKDLGCLEIYQVD